jgi:TP901 family phage tail tape measure protein
MNITKVVLEADSTSIKSATKDLDALQGSGEKTTSAVKAIGAAFLALGAGNVIRGAVTLTADFNQAIADLSAITGATGKDLEFYRNQAKEIGRTTSLSASQAAEAFKLIASAKPDLLSSAESLAAVTKEAVVLAEATGSTLPDAARALGSALNQFQLPASDASRVINALAASSQLGTAEVAAVTEALRNAGSAANSLGIDFESTVAGIQGLAAAGRQGADAGTALRQVMLQLEKSGEQNLRPSIVGLVGALRNLEGQNRDNIELMRLFGADAFTAATALLGQVDVVARLDTGLRGTSTAYEQATTRMNTFNGDMKSLRSAIEALQIEIFSDSVDGLGRSLAQTATGGVNFLTKNLDMLRTAAELAALVVGARMAAALGVSTAAWVVSTQQAIAYQMTLARMAGVSATAAASQTALAGALSLVGGPVGALVLVAGGLALMISRMESATEMTARLRDEMDSLSKEELGRGIEAQRTYNQALEVRIDRLSKQNMAVAANRERMAELRAELEDGQKALQQLENGMRGIDEREFGKMLDEYFPPLVRVEAKVTELAAATAQASNHTADFVRMMDSAAYASYNTESAYSQLIQAYGGAIPVVEQVTTRTTRLTEEQKNASLVNLEAQDSIDEIVAGMGRQSKASEALTQVTVMMRNDISSAFADMMMNGGNAFDNIAKSFERMVYKMVADWAAAGIMNMIGSAFGVSGLGGTSTLGTLISAATGGGGIAGAAGTAATGGGILSSAGSAVSGAGAAIVGGAKAVGSAAMGALSSIPGWGWALGGALAIASQLDKSTPSSNSGILLSDLPGVDPSRKQGTVPFASGVAPVLFARRSDFGAAGQVADALRQADASVMELFNAAGKGFQISGPELAGFSETGGGFGQFFGVAAEDGKVALTAEQSIDAYVRELISAGARYNGMSIPVSGNAESMVRQLNEMLSIQGSHYAGLDYVPFDGYRMEAHRGEAVITARGNEALGLMAGALEEMRSMMAAVAAHTAKTARQLERWDFDGLPEERVFA